MILTEKRAVLILTAIILVGAILRTIFLIEIERVPFFHNPVGDARIYVDRAMDIYYGKIFPEEVSFHSSPIYPYYIAATYALGKTLASPRIVQAITGLGNIVVIFIIARILFGNIPALLAAFFMSVYPLFIYFEGDLMMISLVLFTLNLSCLMFVLYSKTRARRYIALGGVFLGISAMGKPDVIAIAPAMVLYLLISEKNIRQGLTRACMLVLWIAMSISPVTLTNIFLLGDAVILTSNGGINFYIGNHQGASGMFNVPPDSGLWDHKLYVSSKEVAQQATGRELTPAQVSKFWFNKGKQFIVNHPVEFLRLTGKKILLMINRFEVANHHSFYFFRKWSDIIAYNPLRLSIFVAFAVIGLFMSLRDWRKYLILYIYLGVTFWVIVFFFVTARYRLPTVPFYIMFASLAMYRIWLIVKDKQYLRVTKHLIPVAVIYALTCVPLSGFDGIYNQDMHNLGNVYMSLKQYDKALKCYMIVRRNNPQSLFNYYNIGNVYLVQGKTELAISEFLKELDINPKFQDTYIRLGQIYLSQGRYEKALGYFNQAVELEFSLSAMVNIGYIYFQLGDIERAIGIFERLYAIDPSNPPVIRNLIICYEAVGQTQKAQEFRDRLMGK